jgi:prevent-host-death family protein
MSVMATPVAEMSVRELRADLADVINAAATRDQVTFVTSRGRRIGGVVSVAAAEQAAAGQGQAGDDAGTAVMYAVNLAMLLDRGGTPDLTPAECFEDYAESLLRDLGGNADRALAAARAVAAESVPKTGYPMLWRQAALAVELCQRGVEMTGQVLPGSYRPGSREDSAAWR